MATVRDRWLNARMKQRTARWGVGLRWQAVWDVNGREVTVRRLVDHGLTADAQQTDREPTGPPGHGG